MSRNKLGGIIIASVILLIVVVAVVSRPPSSPPAPPPADTHTLSASVNPPGAGSVFPSSGSYESGRQVTLIANPGDGYRFAQWTGDIETVANPDAASTTITMYDSYSVTARFEADMIAGPHRISDVRGKLSPDWSKIAFQQGGALWVSRLDGTQKTKVLSSVRQYSWSPDGARIAYYRTTRRDSTTYWAIIGIVDSDASNDFVLYKEVIYFPDALSKPKPSVSPDGRLVFYLSYDKVCYIVPADGSGPPAQLHIPRSYLSWDHYEQERLLSWSPTSDAIIAKILTEAPVRGPGVFAIGELRLEGGIKRIWFTLPSGVTREEVLSPDRRRLAFQQREGGLAIVNADGTNLIQTGLDPALSISWSQDSKKLACLLSEDVWVPGRGEYVTVRSMWVMNADGTDRRKVLESASIEDIQNWSPDGLRVAYTTSADDGIYAVPVG